MAGPGRDTTPTARPTPAAVGRWMVALAMALSFATVRAEFTDQSLILLPPAVGVSHAFAVGDVDGNGTVDVFVAAEGVSRLLINDGTGLLSDESAGRLPATDVSATGAVLLDVDGDTDADLFVAGAVDGDRLWLNDGAGVFSEAAPGALPAVGGVSMAVAAVDVDGDGDADLVIARHDGADRVLVNDGSGVFTDQTEQRLPGQASPGADVAVADANGDGSPDLLLAGFSGPALYLNNGLGSFAPVSLPAAPAPSTGAAWIDVDADGDPDLVLAGGEAGLRVLVNDGSGQFADESDSRLPPWNGFAIRVIAADVTEDGADDLVVSLADGLRVLVNDGSGLFTDESAGLLPPDPELPRVFGVAAVDLDQDLDRDLLGATVGAGDRLLVNGFDSPRVRVAVSPGYVETGDAVTIGVDAFDEDGVDTLVLAVHDPAAGITPVTLLAGEGVFTPSLVGVHEAVATATDGLGNVTTRRVAFEVSAPDGTAPVVTVQALPDPSFVGQAVAITVDAVDSGGIAARTLTVGGAPVPVDNAGNAVYVSTLADAGTTLNVSASATDAAGNTGVGDTTITIDEDTTGPVVTLSLDPAPPATVALLDPVSILVTASETGSPVTTRTVTVTPPSGGAVAVPLDGAGNGLYTPLEPGVHQVLAIASNASGASTSADVSFEATGVVDATPPQVTLSVDRESVLTGGSFNLHVEAIDDVAVTDLTLTVNGSALALSAEGNAVFTATLAGDYTVVAMARDGFGNEDTAQLVLRAVDAADDTTPPQVAIAAPADDSEVAGRVSITGTATDETLASYSLAVAPAGTSTFTTFATGSLPVVNGELGVLDTATLSEGFYEVRLTAVDANGVNVSTSVTVLYVDNVALGRFTLETEDMRLSAFGLPFAVQRTYDSTSNDVGDFGLGWKMRLLDLELRTDSAGNVFVTLPDGRRTAFALTPQGSAFFPIYATVYTPPAGIYDSLSAPGCESLVRSGGQWFCGLGDPFPPTTYQLGLKNGTTYTIDDGKVTRVEDRNGNALDLGPAGLIASSGRSITFQRDGAGRITSATDPNGGVFSYVYDSLGRLAQTTDQEGRVTRYTYDGNSNRLTETETADDAAELGTPASCEALRNEFYPDGRIAARQDAAGNRTTYAYDDVARSETVTDPNGNVTTYYYDQRGNIVEVHDALGTITRYTYDEMGNETSIERPSGHVSTYTYDASGNRTSETHTPEPGVHLTSTSTYNEFGQVASFTRPLGDRTQYVHDADGNLLRREHYDTLGVLLEQDVYTYDGDGNRLTWTNAKGATTTYEYLPTGERSRQTDPAGVVTDYEYDANGNLSALIDGLGNRAEFEYDGLNNRTQMREGGVVRYSATYDELGNLTSLTNGAGSTTAYTYDCSGNLVSVAGPESDAAAYEYDGVTNLTRVTDARGKVTTYDYDAALRPIARNGPDGQSWEFGYNPDGIIDEYTSPEAAAALEPILHVYDGMQRLATRSEPERDIEYVYDANNRLVEVVDNDGVAPLVTTYSYDDMGNVLQAASPEGSVHYTWEPGGRRDTMATPDGIVTAYDYDAAGRIETMTTTDGGTSDSVTFFYDAAGRRERADYSNGAYTTYDYDGLARITGVTIHDASGAVVAQFDYTLNADGQRTAVNLVDGSASYTYDELYRLTAEELDTVSTGVVSNSWSYDAAGNRLDAGAVYGDDNRLLEDASGVYGYDLNGNVRSHGASTFSYDSNNRLVGYSDGVDSASYAYDYLGRRVVRTVNGATTTYLYDGHNIVAEIVGGAVARRYTHGPGMDEIHLARVAGQSFFFHTDGLGSVVAITDSAGNLVKSYSYDAWGNVLSETGGLPFDNTILFVGREFDVESGLYHVRQRAYDPRLGRFLQKDPLQGVLKVPQSLNLYAYARSNPVNFIDPTGRLALVEYGFILSFPNGREVAAALAGFLHGFGATNLVFIAEFLGVVGNTNGLDIQAQWDLALTRTESRMEEIKSALGVAESASDLAGVASIPSAFKGGVTWKVGFEINISTPVPGVGASGGVSVEASGGGFENGVTQGLNYLRQVGPR